MSLAKRIFFVLLASHLLSPEGLTGVFTAAFEGEVVRLCALVVLLLWLSFDAQRDDALKKGELLADLGAQQDIDHHHSVATAVMNLTCSYDPANCLALQHFQPVVKNSRCLFAKAARVWGSRDYNENWSLEENVRASAPMFLQMLLRGDKEGLDGFVFEVRGDKFAVSTTSSDDHPNDNSSRGSHDDDGDGGGGGSARASEGGVYALADATRRVLCTLSDCDPKGEGSARKRYVGDKAWHFVFAGRPVFVTTFAACYAANHSRHAYGAGDHGGHDNGDGTCPPSYSNSVFILLQPESSFLRHDLPPDTPHTKWEGGPGATIRDRIRISFRSTGQEYDIPDTTHYPASEHIVKPQWRGGEVVRWWV